MWHMGPSLGANGELGRAWRVTASSGRRLFMRCEADQRQSPGRDHCGKGSPESTRNGGNQKSPCNHYRHLFEPSDDPRPVDSSSSKVLPGVMNEPPDAFLAPRGINPPMEHRGLHLDVKDERTNEAKTIWPEAYDERGGETDRPGFRCSLSDRYFDIETLHLLVDFSTAVPDRAPSPFGGHIPYALCKQQRK